MRAVLSDPAAILRAIEHTLLRPEAGPAAVRRVCAEAVSLGLGAVCVHPDYVALARREVAGSGVRVVTVAGFPLGANTSEVKAREAERAARDGADEVDMVLNLGRLKEGELAAVRADIAAVVAAAGVPVKVILETGYLTDAEVVAACRLAEEAGARFVKTATGFGPGGATIEAVRLMRASVGPGVGVKAAGGIRTAEQVLAFLDAGADRIGSSAGAAIARALAGTAG